MRASIGDTFGAANGASRLKVGVAVIYTPRERLAETAERLKADPALAERMGVPILVQVDTENWLPEPLTNWFDPAKPGYDPSKVHLGDHAEQPRRRLQGHRAGRCSLHPRVAVQCREQPSSLVRRHAGRVAARQRELHACLAKGRRELEATGPAVNGGDR